MPDPAPNPELLRSLGRLARAAKLLRELCRLDSAFGVPAETLEGAEAHEEANAILDRHAARSASITAATDILSYGLTAWEFKPFVEEHPQVAWAMLQTLAGRLREAQAHEHTH